MPGVSFTDPLVKLALVSGAEWTVTLSDVLLTLAILLLLAEVIKGARPGAKYLTDHLLSLIVFGAAAAEFVMWPKFGTSTYLPDDGTGAGGFPRPALPCGRGAGPSRWRSSAPSKKPRHKKVERAPGTPSPRPSRSGASAAAARRSPPATSVAESVLQDRPDPKPADSPLPEGAPVVPGCGRAESPWRASWPEIPSPEVPSPGLQPVPAFAPPDKPDPKPCLRAELDRLPGPEAGAVARRSGSRRRRSARPPATPAAGCGSAGPGRRLRSAARGNSGRAAAAGLRRQCTDWVAGTSSAQAGSSSVDELAIQDLFRSIDIQHRTP